MKPRLNPRTGNADNGQHQDHSFGYPGEPNHDNESEMKNVLPAEAYSHPAVSSFLISFGAFLVTNPRLPGNPIVYASPGFLELTGFPIRSILGRSCRFLQGPETDPATAVQMRNAIDHGRDVTVTLLNYRQNGTTFWNHVMISGVRGGEKETDLLFYVGVQHLLKSPPGYTS